MNFCHMIGGSVTQQKKVRSAPARDEQRAHDEAFTPRAMQRA